MIALREWKVVNSKGLASEAQNLVAGFAVSGLELV